jgi:DNA excision repair protein ERCC-3
MPSNPVIVQSDMTVLLETMGELYEPARDFLGQFAELRKSPEYLHTYCITPLSLWNAASAGISFEQIIEGLEKYTKYEIPQNVRSEIQDAISRFGRIRLVKNTETGDHVLVSEDKASFDKILANASVRAFIQKAISPTELLIIPGTRGRIKQALIKIGFPVDDVAGYTDGDSLSFRLRSKTLSGQNFALRHYQRDAIDVFYAGGAASGGSGVLVLPCGAGKTVIGIGCMEKIQQNALILTTNITALRQWMSEILDKTTLSPDQVGEYSGETKDVRPVTVSTYQILTYKKRKTDEFAHMDLFQKYNWGVIVYDEVHLLPAPVFRAVAEIQARRRLGLTATLVREDNKEDDVFSLIGPKRFDKPWKELEKQGFIAEAQCVEVRVPLAEERRMEYAVADLRSKYRISMENPSKFPVVETLLKKHVNDNVLVIGQYLDQLEQIRKRTGAPIITGETPNAEREVLYADFKSGKNKVLIVSKVANFAVDLPDANVAIQISGTYRSRQEETQRLGRVLRPKEGSNYAYFYSVVTKDTKDQECAKKRSMFLTEQGYRYRICILSGNSDEDEELLMQDTAQEEDNVEPSFDPEDEISLRA